MCFHWFVCIGTIRKYPSIASHMNILEWRARGTSTAGAGAAVTSLANYRNYARVSMTVAGSASIFERGRVGSRHTSVARGGWALTDAPACPARRRCFAVFSLLIILLDLVRRGVVHCTRLRTPRLAADTCVWNLPHIRHHPCLA